MSEKRKNAVLPMTILTLLAVVLAIFTMSGPRSIEDQFVIAVSKDLENLRQQNFLPEGFNDLKRVEVFGKSENLKTIFNRANESFKTSTDGKYALEVFLDVIDEGGVILQYDLVEIKSGNTVWELGRTFKHNLPKN
jgi:hypothetical protein